MTENINKTFDRALYIIKELKWNFYVLVFGYSVHC